MPLQLSVLALMHKTRLRAFSRSPLEFHAP
jgi:hypothetical protein